MKGCGWMMPAIAFAIVVAVSACAGEAGVAGYEQAIVTRNCFELREAPQRVVLPPPPRPQTQVCLVGLTTILGDRRAILTIQEPEAGARPVPCILAEGGMAGGILVLKIDMKAETVHIQNKGVDAVVKFSRNNAQTRV